MDVKAALGAPIPRAFMPPRPAEYLELQNNLANRTQQPIPKLEGAVKAFYENLTEKLKYRDVTCPQYSQQ